MKTLTFDLVISNLLYRLYIVPGIVMPNVNFLRLLIAGPDVTDGRTDRRANVLRYVMRLLARRRHVIIRDCIVLWHVTMLINLYPCCLSFILLFLVAFVGKFFPGVW